MTGTSFVKMRRRSGYGLTRASGSCFALTLLLTSLGHDSGCASDQFLDGGMVGFGLGAWLDSGYMVYVSPWVGRSYEPLVSGTSSSLLVLAQCLIRLWIHVLIQGGFWKYFVEGSRGAGVAGSFTPR